MSTEPRMSRLQRAIAKMDEAESKLRRQILDLELQEASDSTPATKERLAELASAIESIQSARELLRQVQQADAADAPTGI